MLISPQGYSVVCFLANVGQEEDWAEVEKKALALGAERMVIENLEREFVDRNEFRVVFHEFDWRLNDLTGRGD